MSDANHGDRKRKLPRGRHGRKRLTDAELKEVFLELVESFKPSEEEIKRVREMIPALIAVADMENAYQLEKIRELERMVGIKDEGKKKSFTDKEDSRKKPSGFGRGE